jgi:hypothetical protein
MLSAIGVDGQTEMGGLSEQALEIAGEIVMKTGTFCCYVPDPANTPSWRL